MQAGAFPVAPELNQVNTATTMTTNRLGTLCSKSQVFERHSDIICRYLFLIFATLPALVLAAFAVAATAQSVDFNHDIRPILNEHCSGCHGGVKKNGGFSVNSRELLLGPADSGDSVVVPGDSYRSNLMRRVTAADISERMPPEDHDGLNAGEIDLLKRWIDTGANWPVHWAYQPLPFLRPASSFDDRHPIDWFVRRKLEFNHIQPSSPAEPLTLARRLSLDLTGLLPDTKTVESLNRSSGSALRSDELDSLVDSLLAMPQFGERWARHWLDEARYADSEGYEKDSIKSDAFRFRDWVIQAINSDMPFDEFTRRQIAGDLMAKPSPDDLIATKFHLQTQFNLEGGVDSEEDRTKRVIDRVGTLGTVWMGSSVACCQCHDHPYDSFRQTDFYRLYAFFNNADFTADFLGHEPADADQKRAERGEKWAELTRLLQHQLTDKNYNDEALHKMWELRVFDNDSGFTRYLQERISSPRKTWVFTRGDFLRPMIKAGEVTADVPATLGSISARATSPDRLDLVKWLVSPNNPLTARVTVNKVWMHLFGQPLADQPQEFGTRGSAPSHPELLDYLARWFVDEAKWSRKQLIRLIVSSQTYQQSAKVREELVPIDPNNRLLARQNRFRVEAEIIRDISLQAAGLLSLKVGGPSVFPPLPAIVAQQTYAGNNKYTTSTGEDRYRRGLYTFFRRTAIDPNLTTFDCPDSSLTRAQRDRSNNPLQALATLHNEVFHEAAQGFAQRLLESETATATDQFLLNEAFLIAIGRPPTESEVLPLKQLLTEARKHFGAHTQDAGRLIGDHAAKDVAPAENAAWITVTRVILNADEFLTRS